MGIKNILFGDPETQGMMFRIRVFDHGHHIKTATVKNRGQDRINLVVKPKDYYFLGEEVKLAFMINPEIIPHYFGNVAEIDFDIRDATQLADLFDLCPDLVYSINKTFHQRLTELKRESNNVQDAEFTEEKETKEEETGQDKSLEALTDPIPDPVIEPEKELSGLEKSAEKIPGVKTVTKGIDAVVNIPRTVRTEIQAYRYLYEISKAGEKDNQELVRKALDFCMQPGNAKCLRWMPKYLHIEPEIMAIVSQTELDGVGIMPMYYIKQSSAEISEKMLTRPKTVEDWKVTLIYGAIALCFLLATVFFILKLAGRI
jgi:hypothetical protein